MHNQLLGGAVFVLKEGAPSGLVVADPVTDPFGEHGQLHRVHVRKI